MVRLAVVRRVPVHLLARVALPAALPLELPAQARPVRQEAVVLLLQQLLLPAHRELPEVPCLASLR